MEHVKFSKREYYGELLFQKFIQPETLTVRLYDV